MQSKQACVVGALVKQFRKEKGWSLERLAKHLGVSRRTVYNYEIGDTDIPSTKLLSLCKVFSPEFTYELFGYKILDVEISYKIKSLNLKEKKTAKRIFSCLEE